jgi:ankyrin repeat protein
MRMIRKALQTIVITSIYSAHAGSYDDFFRAVVRDDSRTLQALVGRGFDPNSVDEEGQTGLTRALMVDSFEAALLLARLPTTDVRRRNRAGETGLMVAALKGQVDICRALLERGAPVDSEGWTALHYAASGNSLSALKLLLTRGAAVDARAPNGRTPLMMAVLHASEEVADALLAAGADPAARDRAEYRPADLARLAGRDSYAQRLEAAEKQGRNPR